MLKIKLGSRKGKELFTVVNDENAGLGKKRWYVNNRGYVVREENGVLVYLHREVLPASKRFFVDHINGDKLDNRRSNLRAATSAQNTRNQQKQIRPTTSRFKGVCWKTRDKRWQSKIRYERKGYHLGNFVLEHDAALMYDFWATYLHGEFARTNFPVVASTEKRPASHEGEAG